MSSPNALTLNLFNPWLNAMALLEAMFPAAPSGSPAAIASSSAFAMTECHAHYSWYMPPGIKHSRPMVVMLHGASQDPADFAAGTAMNEVAARHGFIVLYPCTDNAHRCWNWFDVQHQSRGGGEAARLAELTVATAKRCDADRNRLYVAGLSAGGAMAALLGALFPEVFAAVGVHSGLAPEVATDLATALAAMRGAGRRREATPSGMPTIVFHGDRDETVHASNGDQIIAACVDPTSQIRSSVQVGPDGRRSTRRSYGSEDGRLMAEHWTLHDAAHAWSGGRIAGSFADPRGPDASAEMLRFFSEHRLPGSPVA